MVFLVTLLIVVMLIMMILVLVMVLLVLVMALLVLLRVSCSLSADDYADIVHCVYNGDIDDDMVIMRTMTVFMKFMIVVILTMLFKSISA